MWKRLLIGALALVIIVAMAVPSTAVDVSTGVSISTGGGAIPVVKCKWEQDQSGCLEDGDSGHSIPGSQFLPPMEFDAVEMVDYFVVVTDAEENGNVQLVSVDVYHPDNCWGDGSFKYQVMLDQLSKADGIAYFKAAASAGLIAYDSPFDYAEVLYELDKDTAAVWMGSGPLHYCQPAGDYGVTAFAVDHNNNPSIPFMNTFEYVPTAVLEFDFTDVNYGAVNIGVHKWISGDMVFGTADKPTVRNIGNVDAKVKIYQDDMGFGNSQGVWNVKYDARMGSDNAYTVNYGPFEWITLPNALPRCELEELDFSIEIIKGFGAHTGVITLGQELSCEEENGS
jgi:hypothetical protein